MNHLDRMLEPLVDRPTLDMQAVIEVLIEEAPGLADFELDRLVSVVDRFPSGLVHAEELWLVTTPPVGAHPLSRRSAWYAFDRTLLVVLSPGRRALIELARALGEFTLRSRQLRERLSEAEALRSALVSGELEREWQAGTPRAGSLLTQLALHLDAGFDTVAELARRSPMFLKDLASLVAQSFAPKVHIHASARPAKGRRHGAVIGRRLLADLPSEVTIRLVIADGRELLEHVSPYLRDLRQALALWAAENRGELSIRGLDKSLEAAASAGAEPDPDQLALVVPDLLGGHPELLPERREVERTAGLRLFDEPGMSWGWADLGKLEGADPIAVPRGAGGVLAMIAGGSEESVVEAARAVLASGRVSALGLLLGAEGLEAPLVAPELLFTAADGFRIEGAAKLEQRAKETGQVCLRKSAVDADATRIAEGALELLRALRRAEVLGLFPSAAVRNVLLYARPERDAELQARVVPLKGARLLLSALEEYGDPRRAETRGKLPNAVRFRV